MRARMLAGLALSERRVRSAGATTALLEGGSGPPLILLHGGIECGGAYWAPVVPRLVRRHRLVIPDVPGLGESEPLARLDAESFASWLRALIGEVCDEPPLLVAHSLVASLVARVAATGPSPAKRFVIAGAPAIGPYRMPLRLRATAIRFGLRPTVRNLERFARFAMLDAERVAARDPDWFGAFTAYSASRARDPGVKRAMRELVRIGTTRIPDAQLQAIEAPVELLWGRHDRMTPLELAQGASARLGWPLRVIDGAAHVPHVETPAAFAEALP